ncbi:hypothetical protein [Aquimarina longa]|uniref:hypothetical protein n=1 Tax=Aquimarina longa TaxID=1080221 RepID=UPI00078330A7|nr:hypothetical protein [Aquimarina longa]
MKKYLSYIFVLWAFVTSCNKDDDGGAIALVTPTEVSNIGVEKLSGTTIKVYWDAPKNKEITSYDVIVNDKIKASKITDTSIEFDAVEFISKVGSDKKNNTNGYAKGANLVITIKIKTYDSKGVVSEGVEAKRNIFINRSPEAFEFENIIFDTYSYDYMEVVWKPAIDADKDILSYDVYFNEIVVAEKYIIGSDAYEGLGRVSYRENFGEYIDDEITIKVVANDRSGGSSEIIQKFNFRATDSDLGTLSLPYDEVIDFELNSSEPDDKVGYSFRLSEKAGFSIYTDSDVRLVLKNANGDYISSGRKMYRESLQAGDYYLEISDYYDVSVFGTVTMVFTTNFKSSDVDLGLLTLPHNQSYDFTISRKEIDNKIGFEFQVNENTGYFFSTQSNVHLSLYDANGNYINNSNTKSIRGADLNSGTYYLVLENYNGYSEQNGTINIVLLSDPRLSDISLGTLTVPHNQSFSYNTSNEVDGKIRYGFSISEEANYNFNISFPNYDAYIYLYDNSGNLLNSSDYSAIQGTLAIGNYYVEVGGYASYVGSGTLLFDLQ